MGESTYLELQTHYTIFKTLQKTILEEQILREG
jgi:hypothetical protein